MERALARGDVVVVTLQGDYGKTRPAIVVQTRALSDIPSIVILPCTSDLVPDCVYRPDVPAGEATGLKLPSQAMTDKITAVSRRRVKEVIGAISPDVMEALTRASLFVIGAYDDV